MAAQGKERVQNKNKILDGRAKFKFAYFFAYTMLFFLNKNGTIA
jgi:hypothetical protein